MKSFKNWYDEAKKIKLDGFTSEDFYNAGQLSAKNEIDAMKEALLFQVRMLDMKQDKINRAIQILERSKPNQMPQIDALDALNVLKGNIKNDQT